MKKLASNIGVILFCAASLTSFNEAPVTRFHGIYADGEVRAEARTNAHANDWQPHAPRDASRTPLVHRVSASVTLPATLPAGAYRLVLWIPDGAAALTHNPRYAIRCANSDVEWFITAGGHGINSLTSISIH
jgi:hypothetical protein